MTTEKLSLVGICVTMDESGLGLEISASEVLDGECKIQRLMEMRWIIFAEWLRFAGSSVNSLGAGIWEKRFLPQHFS